ncbi:hypothetical protein [Calditerrivibrio sp.]
MRSIDLIKAYRVLFEEFDCVDSSVIKYVTMDLVESAYKKNGI